MGTILNQFLDSYGIPRSKTDIIGGVGNVLGLLGSIVASILIDKRKTYKPIFMIFIVVAFISQVSLTVLAEVVSQEYSFFVWLLCWCILITSCVPCYAIGMDYVCEITYPVGELIAGGFIMAGSQALGIAETYISDYFLDINQPYWINIMTCGLFMVAFFALFILKEDLKRNKEEDNIPQLKEDYDTSNESDHQTAFIDNENKEYK